MPFCWLLWWRTAVWKRIWGPRVIAGGRAAVRSFISGQVKKLLKFKASRLSALSLFGLWSGECKSGCSLGYSNYILFWFFFSLSAGPILSQADAKSNFSFELLIRLPLPLKGCHFWKVPAHLAKYIDFLFWYESKIFLAKISLFFSWIEKTSRLCQPGQAGRQLIDSHSHLTEPVSWWLNGSLRRYIKANISGHETLLWVSDTCCQGLSIS